MSLSHQTSLEDTLHEQQQKHQYNNHVEPLMCQSCSILITNEPKHLECLHVYCKNCIEMNNLMCIQCNNKQSLSSSGDELHMEDDDLHSMLAQALSLDVCCTSCKTNERAVARCLDCLNSLCSNCVTAHQYMKCFDNHKVVPFNNGGQHMSPTKHTSKPTTQAIAHMLNCKTHSNEYIKFYCITCDLCICAECVISMHHSHAYERLNETESKNLQEIYAMMREAKEKIDFCRAQSDSLNNYFADLQEQYETSQGNINEIYHTYKALLEKRRDDVFHELEEKHSQKEVNIMEMSKSIEDSINQITDLVRFAEKALKNANSIEILQLKRQIFSQIRAIFKQIPEANLSINLKFQSDKCRFEKALQDYFGHFVVSTPTPTDDHSNHFNSSNSNTNNTSDDNTSNGTSTSGCVIESSSSDWLLSLTNQKNSICFGASATYGSNDHLTMTAPTTTTTTTSSISPTQNWSNNLMLLNDHHHNHHSATNGSGSSKQHSPPSPANSEWLMNMANLQSQYHQQTNAYVSQDSSTTFTLINGHSLGNSRSQTPGVIGFPSTTNPSNGLQTITMDEFLPYDNSMRLSKFGIQSVGNGGGSGACVGNGSLSNSVSPPLHVDTQNNPNFMGNGNLNPPVRNGKMSHMQIRCKFGQLGPAKSQFNSPHGFCLGMDEEIIVADTNNHRIQLFDKTGEFKYQFGVPGREEGQLWYPRKVTVMRSTGKFVVCDRGNERSRMQIFNKNGHFIKKIAIRYIDIVAGLAITQHGHIVAVDSVSPTVFCISEAGDLLKWFDCSDYMREPSDIAVSGKEYFVCDFKGHCVVVFNEDGNFMRRIGGENITNFPNGIDVSDAGDVLVGDSHGNRFHVAVFSREGSLLSEFECPYVKVSRCCGLKITSEGYVVTLAKNNHHVLILNTLYVS